MLNCTCELGRRVVERTEDFCDTSTYYILTAPNAPQSLPASYKRISDFGGEGGGGRTYIFLLTSASRNCSFGILVPDYLWWLQHSHSLTDCTAGVRAVVFCCCRRSTQARNARSTHVVVEVEDKEIRVKLNENSSGNFLLAALPFFLFRPTENVSTFVSF